MAKERTLGVYVGLAVDPAVDWEKVCSDAAAAGYTSICLFLTTMFYGRMQPWPFAAGKYDFSVINPDYRAHFKAGCFAFKKHNLKMHLCVVDQFHGTKDAGPNDNPHDPFRQVFGDWDEEPLYSSWDGSKYTWLGWDPDEDPKYKATPIETLAQYRPIGAFGRGMWNFMRMIANVLKNTEVDFSIKWGNETFARMEGNKKVASRGDRDECVIWMRSILRAADLEPFDMYFDFLAFDGGMGREDVDYDIMRAAFEKGIRKKHKAKLEVHGILTIPDTDRFGFTDVEEKFIKWSTDGDLRMIGDYMGLGHSSLPDVDLKMDARVVKEKTVMDFFNRLMPKYSKYVK